ncbi:hypothetical protein HMPREF0083_03798 [Aneurinibacillus aneurinilyticus ATCC 12856]|uniref:Uncharacterized protein n=1 Tax=Aneurinibacillus aneurinilyticus ATCC 12856 TaxID=649747 RepID=U1YBE1_ANEAE|nr:hypothetical protein HMPREF0083_03798 [Aneurinibacillus aneurinilyticus ATCC 12856]
MNFCYGGYNMKSIKNKQGEWLLRLAARSMDKAVVIYTDILNKKGLFP